ncbi:NAD(P)-binding domain-containing protein [Streptomyces sp. SD15]
MSRAGARPPARTCANSPPGGETGAVAGTLSIMVGGTPADFEEALGASTPSAVSRPAHRLRRGPRRRGSRPLRPAARR